MLTLLVFIGSIETAKLDLQGILEKEALDVNVLDVLKNDIISAIQFNKIDTSAIQEVKKDILSAIDKLHLLLARETKEEKAPVDTKEKNVTLIPTKEKNVTLIPKGMSKLFAGMARVDREAFFDSFDIGVPKDDPINGNEEVLLLYSNADALPTNTSGNVMPLLSPQDATQHCHTLKVVLTEPNKQKECIALVGQWETYHVHKWMRLPPGKGPKFTIDEANPLRYVSRLHIDNGLAQRIPTPPKVKEYNSLLVKYLSSLDKVLEELKPIAQKVAKDNTIVVMVCNHGQSELLMNFACSSLARGFDLSQVLVFATDLETKELAEGLGLTAFYDHMVRVVLAFLKILNAFVRFLTMARLMIIEL